MGLEVDRPGRPPCPSGPSAVSRCWRMTSVCEKPWNLIRRCSVIHRAGPAAEAGQVRRPPVPDHRWRQLVQHHDDCAQLTGPRLRAQAAPHGIQRDGGRRLISTYPHGIDPGLSTATGFRLASCAGPGSHRAVSDQVPSWPRENRIAPQNLSALRGKTTSSKCRVIPESGGSAILRRSRGLSAGLTSSL